MSRSTTLLITLTASSVLLLAGCSTAPAASSERAASATRPSSAIAPVDHDPIDRPADGASAGGSETASSMGGLVADSTSTAPVAPAPAPIDVQARLDAIPDDADNPYGTDASTWQPTQDHGAAADLLLAEAEAEAEGGQVVLLRRQLVGFPGTAAGSINSVRWIAIGAPASLAHAYSPVDANGHAWAGWGGTDTDVDALRARVAQAIAAEPDAAEYRVYVHAH